MKAARDIVNAVALFCIFLVCWAFLNPGYVRGSSNPPRFVRLQVEETGGDDTRISLAIPFGLVGGTLRFATLGQVERELSREFRHHVEAEELREILASLEETKAPVTRELDGSNVTFTKEEQLLKIELKEHPDDDESVTMRVPFSIVNSILSKDRGLDADTLVDELATATKGDLVDIKDRDGRVRVWIE